MRWGAPMSSDRPGSRERLLAEPPWMGSCEVVTQRFIFNVAFCPGRHKLSLQVQLRCAMKTTKLFFLSDNDIANRLGASEAYDRMPSLWSALVIVQ